MDLDGELAAALLLIVGGFFALSWGARRVFSHLEDPLRPLRKVPLSTVAELREGAVCRVVGTLRAAPGHRPVTAPLSGQSVLACRTELQVFDWDHDRTSDSARETYWLPGAAVERAVEALVLEDATGQVEVRLRGAPLRLRPVRAMRYRDLSEGRVDALLDPADTTLAREIRRLQPGQSPATADWLLEESALAIGEHAVVVGRCHDAAGATAGHLGPYRGPASRPTIIPDKTHGLLLAADETALRKLGS